MGRFPSLNGEGVRIAPARGHPGERHWWACGRSGRGKRRSWRPRPRSSWWATKGVRSRPRCPWLGNCCFFAGRGPTTPVTDLERRLKRTGRHGQAYDGASSRESCRRAPALAWCFRPRQPESGPQTAYIEGSTGDIWAGIHMYRAPGGEPPEREEVKGGALPYGRGPTPSLPAHPTSVEERG